MISRANIDFEAPRTIARSRHIQTDVEVSLRTSIAANGECHFVKGVQPLIKEC